MFTLYNYHMMHSTHRTMKCTYRHFYVRTDFQVRVPDFQVVVTALRWLVERTGEGHGLPGTLALLAALRYCLRSRMCSWLRGWLG